MTNTRSRLADGAAYVAVRVAGCVLQFLPKSWSLAFAHSMARLAYKVDRRHRNAAIENLRRALPGRYTEDQLRAMTLGVYRHFATMLLELLFIPRKYSSRRWRDEWAANVPEPLRIAAKSRRPTIVVTAHYGNWELSAFVLRACGFRAHLVARPMDNPYLDDMMRRFRESCGHKVLSKQGDMAKMLAVLDAGGVVCTLADQDAGERGMFVDFFGQPASTHKAIAIMAQRANALLVVVGMQNLGGLLNYAIRATDIIDPRDYAAHPDAVRAITQRLTTGIETLVRFDPGQYLWLHRRWKSQPQLGRDKKAA